MCRSPSLSLSVSLWFALPLCCMKLCITKTVKSLRKPTITPTTRLPDRQPDTAWGNIHMHVTACLSPSLSLSFFLSLSRSIKKKLPDIDSLSVSHSLSWAFRPQNTCLYAWIFAKRTQVITMFGQRVFRIFPPVEAQDPTRGGLACSAWSWLGGLAWVLCINYRPTRRVPNQCLHFYLFCWGATGNWQWSWGIPWGLRS